MRPVRLFLQLFISYVFVVVAAVAMVAGYVSYTVRGFYIERTAARLAGCGLAVDEVIGAPLAAGDFARVDQWCATLAAITGARVTVVTASGRVAGDSEGDAETMENHRGRPEIVEALAGRTGRHVRFSDTLQKEMLYVAVPLHVQGETPGAVRLAVPLTFLEGALGHVTTRIAIAGACIAGLASLAALWIARRITRPLEQMTAFAKDFAEGRIEQRLVPGGAMETAALGRALNAMADQFEERLWTIRRQHHELEAVLSSMVEGVLAIDGRGRVLSLNRAAVEYLHVPAATAAGRPLREMVRNPELHEFIERVFALADPIEGEVVLYEGEERYLQLHGARLKDSEGHAAGAVIVLNDVTRLRRLERVRREFVANVSHEIRTPVTSIKGYIETLLDGAMDDPATCRRFLETAARQADRLNEIIQDLLTLARIEQDSRGGISREQAPLRGILEAALGACSGKAAARGMELLLRCDAALAAHVNPPLLEQAVMNLVDNAITYSEPGDTIEIEASSDNGAVAIRVIDHGPGIERRHLPRLFERFYRVDKARSRKAGGTGLGLAIVKHIVQAHEGRVEVQSAPGQGSTFTLHLPDTDEGS